MVLGWWWGGVGMVVWGWDGVGMVVVAWGWDGGGVVVVAWGWDGGVLVVVYWPCSGTAPVSSACDTNHTLNAVQNSLCCIRNMFWRRPPAPKVLGSDSKKTNK